MCIEKWYCFGGYVYTREKERDDTNFNFNFSLQFFPLKFYV